jgi:predicted AAA+ superfamily ATPase
MESLYEQFAFKLRNVAYKHKRYLYERIDWNRKLVIIKGTRRVGKTTLALQYVKENYKIGNAVLYVSSDNFYFSEFSLSYLIENFVTNGGKHIFIDEIHKYPEWISEIEKVLKKFDELKIVLIGTAVAEYSENEFIFKQAAVYELAGLSFREYILFSQNIYCEVYSLKDIIENHSEICSNITREFDPLALFPAYLKYGYYPLFLEQRNKYHDILSETVSLVLESDLTYAKNIDFGNIHKIKKLLYNIALNPGEKPNIKKMSEAIGATRGTVLQYLDYLKKANILNLVKDLQADDSFMTKPEEIFLNNPNLFFAFGLGNKNERFLNKTFFQNQLSFENDIRFSQNADFIINNDLSFIIDKIEYTEQINFNSDMIFFPTDNIEIGVKSSIPLWIFGFMY